MLGQEISGGFGERGRRSIDAFEPATPLS